MVSITFSALLALTMAALAVAGPVLLGSSLRNITRRLRSSTLSTEIGIATSVSKLRTSDSGPSVPTGLTLSTETGIAMSSPKLTALGSGTQVLTTSTPPTFTGIAMSSPKLTTSDSGTQVPTTSTPPTSAGIRLNIPEMMELNKQVHGRELPCSTGLDASTGSFLYRAACDQPSPELEWGDLQSFRIGRTDERRTIYHLDVTLTSRPTFDYLGLPRSTSDFSWSTPVHVGLPHEVHRGWSTWADLGLPLSTSWVYLGFRGYTDLGFTYNFNFHVVVLRKRGNKESGTSDSTSITGSGSQPQSINQSYGGQRSKQCVQNVSIIRVAD
ncbi:hypothetical protein C8R45DRAFT_945948 [Mycena sanguinolenta]|nr:hypothetical protein C8R45DRAFT_945948 [Mycena sanguinolenta]